jgi:DtxR family transcriptional regulator, Mn-dependent transcriptional regulator
MEESADNYLKAIYNLLEKDKKAVATTALAEKLNMRPGSVTEMLKKLHERGWVIHASYQGTTLTAVGKKRAVAVIRRHRLWEVFLADKLGFSWDEVHDLAEQLEHVASDALTDRLDAFLQFPKFDPHGDPIPDKKGKLPEAGRLIPASTLDKGQTAKLVSLADSSPEFLAYLSALHLMPGVTFCVLDTEPFDQTMVIESSGNKITLSPKASTLLFVQIISARS